MEMLDGQKGNHRRSREGGFWTTTRGEGWKVVEWCEMVVQCKNRLWSTFGRKRAGWRKEEGYCMEVREMKSTGGSVRG